MAVQVRANVDTATKKQFGKVCESIGITQADAFGILINGVIFNNGSRLKA